MFKQFKCMSFSGSLALAIAASTVLGGCSNQKTAQAGGYDSAQQSQTAQRSVYVQAGSTNVQVQTSRTQVRTQREVQPVYHERRYERHYEPHHERHLPLPVVVHVF